MLVAGRWDGSDGLPVEIPSRSMGVNQKAPRMTLSARRAIRRRAALMLKQAGFSRVETAIAMGVSPEAVKKSLQRTRRLRDEVLRDAG